MDAGKNALKLDKRRILLAGTGSGCGKTTITAGLLQCLEDRGLRAAAFKCGPDYIDPMFHERVTGRPSDNLDPFFCSEEDLRQMMAAGSADADILVAEGVMGYYDGVGFSARYSTYEVAAATETPVILIVNCRGLGASAGAVLKGFLDWPAADSMIRGVIFNQLPERLYPEASAMARRLGILPAGYIPSDSRLSLRSRHLGLVTAEEVEDFDRKIRLLAETMKTTVDLDAILEIADRAPVADAGTAPFAGAEPPEAGPVIAVAKDRAFCFMYKENLAMLERLGCRLEYFSPLRDRALPEDTQGILLSGGYPELHAAALSKNTAMLQSIRKAAAAGMPILAECGGFMYLHNTLEGEDGIVYPMAGVIDGDCFAAGRLTRFGYVTVTAKQNGLLGGTGMQFRGHEFHYWDSTASGSDFRADKPDGSRFWDCGFHTETMYAGFPHLHFRACPEVCVRFAEKCAAFRQSAGR